MERSGHLRHAVQHALDFMRIACQPGIAHRLLDLEFVRQFQTDRLQKIRINGTACKMLWLEPSDRQILFAKKRTEFF